MVSATPSRHRHEYALRAVWTGAAKGALAAGKDYSRDLEIRIAGKPAVAGSTSSAYGGDDGKHNPEDLLLAALSTCHLQSYLALAVRAGLPVAAYEDDASCIVDMKDGRVRVTEATLRPTVTLAGGGDVEKATRLHAQAHQICFIANSVSFPVTVEPRIVTP
ncbi:peroxiredoxin [Hypericibacter adhaerens]|uniref:Peroxiredoxin n=1 Tax=Hypericibacter adhaerens TaxID=2602016 RepID=A0A5J6MYZ9_9PROT|nr:peroxiredoxin [Hypericibacter adhaerens]